MITETKFSFRPSTNVEFFNETNDPVLQAVKAQLAQLRNDGRITATRTLSDNGLEQYTVVTFDSIETLNAYDDIHSIALDNAYLNYITVNGFTALDYTKVENRRRAYTQTGIDQPFKVTTTYTFQPEEPAGYSAILFSSSLELYQGGINNRTDLISGETQVIVTHQYANSQDYTDNNYNDMFYVPQLAEKGVVRSIKLELV